MTYKIQAKLVTKLDSLKCVHGLIPTPIYFNFPEN